MRQSFGALLAFCFLVCGMSISGEPLGWSVASLPAWSGWPLDNGLAADDPGSHGYVFDLPAEILLAGEPGKITVPGLSPRNQFADIVHLALGVATVVVGGVTGLATPETAGYDLHHWLGWTAAGLAAGTLLSGAWAHHDDVGITMGLNSSNIHAVLGIVGGLLMIAAPLTAPGGGGGEGDDGGGIHAVLGAGGEILMGIAIVVPLAFHPSPVQ
jgi:hypothetical protein